MKITHDEVKRLFGGISDHMIVEIMSNGATVTKLNEVVARWRTKLT